MSHDIDIDMARRHQPPVYLSYSNGRYRVIKGGIPISADKETKEEAIAVAIEFKLTISYMMWNGDKSRWENCKVLPNQRHVFGS